jgi:hypothetical protein
MPSYSRTTRKSTRPRASDRSMVDTPYNHRLAQFHERVASSPPEERPAKMENNINQTVRGTPGPSVFHARRGWKSSNLSPLPVEGGIFSLTFPLIDQALTRFDHWSSSVMAIYHALALPGRVPPSTIFRHDCESRISHANAACSQRSPINYLLPIARP